MTEVMTKEERRSKSKEWYEGWECWHKGEVRLTVSKEFLQEFAFASKYPYEPVYVWY